MKREQPKSILAAIPERVMRIAAVVYANGMRDGHDEAIEDPQGERVC